MGPPLSPVPVPFLCTLALHCIPPSRINFEHSLPQLRTRSPPPQQHPTSSTFLSWGTYLPLRGYANCSVLCLDTTGNHPRCSSTAHSFSTDRLNSNRRLHHDGCCGNSPRGCRPDEAGQIPRHSERRSTGQVDQGDPHRHQM